MSVKNDVEADSEMIGEAGFILMYGGLMSIMQIEIEQRTLCYNQYYDELSEGLAIEIY